ncbi:hypothetical protein DdX_03463 [Ditylenchus destructor]|uniref:Uncharacterized protein n=1 Tax=Ditylenchus destructor TaxID=166010 RepID=A0AAD4RB97_9BILA|nr:hypothetical protein DdX_03463 [Ditylenchus destructor]
MSADAKEIKLVIKIEYGREQPSGIRSAAVLDGSGISPSWRLKSSKVKEYDEVFENGVFNTFICWARNVKRSIFIRILTPGSYVTTTKPIALSLDANPIGVVQRFLGISLCAR